MLLIAPQGLEKEKSYSENTTKLANSFSFHNTKVFLGTTNMKCFNFIQDTRLEFFSSKSLTLFRTLQSSQSQNNRGKTMDDKCM